jgi:hypothetical protein
MLKTILNDNQGKAFLGYRPGGANLRAAISGPHSSAANCAALKREPFYSIVKNVKNRKHCLWNINSTVLYNIIKALYALKAKRP